MFATQRHAQLSLAVGALDPIVDSQLLETVVADKLLHKADATVVRRLIDGEQDLGVD